MLKDNLFENVLIKPAVEDGADRLLIVSGYASAGMAILHLKTLAEKGKNISVELIVGMAKKDAIKQVELEALKELTKTGIAGSSFACRYIVRENPVHVKAYLWLKDNKPVKAFMGSANYTKTAFNQSQNTVFNEFRNQPVPDQFQNTVEVLMECPPDSVEKLFDTCMKMSASCMDSNIENQIKIIKEATATNQDDSNNNNNPAATWINWGIRVPLFDNKDQPIMVKDEYGKDTTEQAYKVLSVGGMPITAKGLKRVPVNDKARTGNARERDYYAYATESNAAMQQIENHIKTMNPGDTFKLPYTLEAEIRIPRINSGHPMASKSPLTFD